MKTIGIYTHDFSAFYDIVKLLKERDVAFSSLASEKVPSWISVVITTKEERNLIKFDNVVAAGKDNIKDSVEKAILYLSSKNLFHKLSIGIDPGERPGVAVYGDETLLTTAKIEFPEDTSAVLKKILDFYNYEKSVVKIGNGAPIFRNRIINSMLPLNVKIKIVDEKYTTSISPNPDIQAAKAIAMMKGIDVNGKMAVNPTTGELKNIKKKSRLLSRGRFTISGRMAEKVAKGKLSLKEAVEKTKNKLVK